MQEALRAIMKTPPFFKNDLQFMAMILAWSGWATSANTKSTISSMNLYSQGFLASSIMGTTFVLFLAMEIRSLPHLAENSTA